MNELDLLVKAGPIGIIVFLLGKEFFAIIKQVINQNDKKPESIAPEGIWNEIENKINTIYESRNGGNISGLPMWHMSKSALKKLDAIEGHLMVQSQLINGMHEKIRDLEKSIDRNK